MRAEDGSVSRRFVSCVKDRKLSYRRERCIIQQTAEQRLGPYPTS